MDDAVTQQYDTEIESGKTFPPGVTINSFKGLVQSAVNQLSPPIENWSVSFLLCSARCCPKRCTRQQVKMLPDDGRRTNRWMYYHQEDYNRFKQDRTQGIDAVYMGRAHGAVSKIEVSCHPSHIENLSTTKATAVQPEDGSPANVEKSKEG